MESLLLWPVSSIQRSTEKEDRVCYNHNPMVELPPVVDLRERLEQSRVSGLYVYPIKSCAGTLLQEAEVVSTGIKHDRELMLIDAEGRFISQRDEFARPLSLVTPKFIRDDYIKVKTPGMPNILYTKITHEGERVEATMHNGERMSVVEPDPKASRWFSEFLEEDCRMVAMAPEFTRQVDQNYAPRDTDQTLLSDGFSFLFLSEESLADLNRRIQERKPGFESLPMNRFRPNVVLSGSGIPYGESLILEAQIGDVVFDFVKRCQRCEITRVKQEEGRQDGGEPLQTLLKYREVAVEEGAPRKAIFAENVENQNTGIVRIGDSVIVKEIQDPPEFLERAA